MPRYKIAVTTWPTSNVPADVSTNTYNVSADTDSAASDATSAILIMHRSFVSLYPNTIRQDEHTYKITDMADPLPQVPFEQGVWSFTGAPTGAPLPPEVAMCLSFKSLPISGVPAGRSRGRVYIGPLRQDRVGTDGRPTAAAMGALRDGGAALLAASVAAPAWSWGIWSKVANNLFPVQAGWVDNEFDTQRRRGRKTTARVVF